VLDAAGVDAGHDRHHLALAAYHGFWEPHTHTDPQVRPLWEGLRQRGIAVGVLSNTIWSRQYHREIFERDGVLDLIDADLYSSELEHVKPHPEAFRAICAALDVEPMRAVYVGDRVFEDVHGPQQVGMRAIWIPHSDIPPSQRVEVTAVPDARAHELLDILAIVDAWSPPR
ncbi:MAG: HAD-IA family hydrolase, partial [Ornithinibacter sp.]